ALLVAIVLVAVLPLDLEAEERVRGDPVALFRDGPVEEGAREIETVLARLPAEELRLALAVLLGIKPESLPLQAAEPCNTVRALHRRGRPPRPRRRCDVFVPSVRVVVDGSVPVSRAEEATAEIARRCAPRRLKAPVHDRALQIVTRLDGVFVG